MKSKTAPQVTRRHFTKQMTLFSGGLMVAPAFVKHAISNPPSERLNIAFIGCGGKGSAHIEALVGQNYTAFCDVDDVSAANAYNTYPSVSRYHDFRVMLEKRHKDIDAVVVTTPDHTHAVAALASMELGKHVYVEKPLTHNITEGRILLEAAGKYGVVTQMGNQGASMDCNREVAEWIRSGVIGDVHTVHVWTNRPVWPQGVPTPEPGPEIPQHLKWDLWIGPAGYRDYSPSYAPFKWRGWWEFGTGALGDMGCHLVDPAYRALKLTLPYAVEASATTVWKEYFVEANYPDSCPPSSIVKFDFPSREGFPECTMWWYDGGLRPVRPVELKEGEAFGGTDGGVLFEGSDGKMTCNIFGENPRILPPERMADLNVPPQTIPRVEGGHQMNFVRACKGLEAASSPFEYAIPLTESLLIGNLAVRCNGSKKLKPGRTSTDWDPYEYPGRTRLLWDAKAMRVTNYEDANAFVSRDYRDGWTLGQ